MTHNNFYKINARLVEFARANSDKISSVWKGNDLEEEYLTYYFMQINNEYDSDLTDKITELDIELSRQTNETFSLSNSPPIKRKENPHLGKLIYASKAYISNSHS